MNPKIIIGSFFGDEGKGAVVNLYSSLSSFVIRFNGGPQAGHTVVHPGTGARHVFSSFCSGSFKGSSNIISKYCAIYPPAIVKEHDELNKRTLSILGLTIDPLTPLIIPTDVINSQKHIDHLNCGYGFGECIKRHETLDYPLRLFAQDLYDLKTLRLKLEAGTTLDKKDIDYYIENCKKSMELMHFNVQIYATRFNMSNHTNSFTSNIIFEGAQGTLLDRQFGFFPYCTRSNTTVENALKIIIKERERQGISGAMVIDVHMVMRPYLTRHGAGPLPYEYDSPMVLLNNEGETNVTNKYQGVFRYAPFNFDLLTYSKTVNVLIVEEYFDHNISIHWYANVTCLDQIPGLVHCIKDDKHVFLEKDKFLENIHDMGFKVVETNGIEQLK